jgi:hypothetical protein
MSQSISRLLAALHETGKQLSENFNFIGLNDTPTEFLSGNILRTTSDGVVYGQPVEKLTELPDVATDGRLIEVDCKLYFGCDGVWNIVSSAVDSFTDLSDTPTSFTGEGLKYLRVNESATGLEFAVIDDSTCCDELSANLTSLSGDVLRNTTNIQILSGDVIDNRNNIFALSGDVTNLNNQVNINKTNINTISGDVIDNTTNITLLSGAIEQFGTDITDYEVRITSNETNISTNIDNIQYNTINIATLSAAVDGIDVDNFVDKTTNQTISGEKIFEDDFTVSAPAGFGEDVTIGAGDTIFNVCVSDSGATQITVSGLLTDGVDDLSSYQ